MGNSIEMAWEAVKGNKLHSVLSIISIIIGIASVIMITSLGNGAKKGIVKELDDLGGNELCIYINSESINSSITDDDIDVLRGSVNGIVGVSAQKTIPGELETKFGKFNVNIECVMYDYRYFDKNGLDTGKYFSMSEYQNVFPVGVISYNDAMRMYGSTDIIGKTVDITVGGKKVTYIIEGVQTEVQTRQTEYVYDDTPVQIIVPMTVYSSYYSMKKNEYSEIFILVDESYDIDMVGDNALNILLRRHNAKTGDFQIANSNDYIKMVNNIILLVTIILALLGTISIIVGGIGVTNIMLLNVKLRTNEIGIRKAMGARDKDILKQFIVESTIMTGIGGSIGIFVGIILSKLICLIIEKFSDITLNVNISWIGVVITLVCSFILGGIWGAMPAKRAANLDPVVAFRQ